MAKKVDKKSKYYNEDVELDVAYRKTTGKYEKKQPVKHKKRGNGLVIAVCILIPVLLLGVAACYFLMPEMGNLIDNGLILENVTIAGANVGGLSKEEAVSAVKQHLSNTILKDPIVVEVLDQSITLSPDMTGVALDVDAAVEAAYAFGRTGSAVQKKEEKVLATTEGLKTDIANYLTVNEAAISAQLDLLEIEDSGSLIQSTWDISGEAPDLHADEAPTELQTLTITKGYPGYSYDRQALMQQILDAYRSGLTLVKCDCSQTEPDPIDLDAIFMENCVAALDAQMDAETFEITPHTYGYAFDLQSAKQAYSEADYGTELTFPFALIHPEQFTADLASKLFQDVLASYESYQASGSNRVTNMKLACEAINGTILLPGEVFDFNATVGERTPEKGYKTAASYSGGETVQTYGGGICQPSSTIYYCALLADLEIVERDCHTYASSYVPYGMDATVNWGTLNFKFRNNTQYPLRIDASADDYGTVSITLMGTDTKDYYVKMEYEFIGGSEPEVKKVKMTQAEADEKGYKNGQTITSPIWGSKVQTYKLKYSKADDSLISKEKEAISVYTKRDKEVVQIIDADKDDEDENEEKPTETPEEEEPTDPPVEETDPPVEETDPPVEETDPPVEETDPPAEETPSDEEPSAEEQSEETSEDE